MPAAAARSKLQDDPSTFPLTPAPVAIGEVLGKPPGAVPLPVPTTTIEEEANMALTVPVAAAAGELVVENTLLSLLIVLSPPPTVVEIVVIEGSVIEALLDAATEEEATTLADEESTGGAMTACELLLVEATEAGGTEVATEAEVDAALEIEDVCEQGTTVVIVVKTVVAVAP